MLDPPVAREVEDGALAELRIVEIAGLHQQFVTVGRGFNENLTIRIDDQAAADQGVTILVAAFGNRHDKGRVLIGAGLHRQAVVEQALMRTFRRPLDRKSVV